MLSELERRELREIFAEWRADFEEDADDALCVDIEDDGLELVLSEDDLAMLDAIDAEDGVEVGIEFRALLDAAHRWTRRQIRAAVAT